MKKHDKYKDSGIAWLGKIPEDWTETKGKYCFDINTGRLDANAEEIDGIYPFFTCSNRIKKINTFAFDCEALLIAGNGDVGYTQYYNGKFNAYQRTYVLRNFSMDVYPIYVKYYFLGLFKQSIETKFVGSVIDFIKVGNLQNFKICFPRLDKQKNIACFLDNKLEVIDKIIDDKKKLIEKLKEYRQAIINEAVTKGLNKSVSMKDSGVDWIGDVPISWDIYKIRRVFDIVKHPYMLENRPVLSITQTGIKVKDITKNDGQLAQSYVGYQEVNVGDFAMNGMDLLTGNVDCSIYNGVTSPDYRVFRFKNSSKMNSDYYKHLFQQCYSRKIFYKFGQGVSNLGRWRLQTEVFLDFNIPVPALDEQAKIGNYINGKTNKINAIVISIEQQISKLQEYKKSIISEAVTGKIKIEERISEGVI